MFSIGCGEHRQGFVITHIETDYHSPAHLHDQLYVETSASSWAAHPQSCSKILNLSKLALILPEF